MANNDTDSAYVTFTLDMNVNVTSSNASSAGGVMDVVKFYEYHAPVGVAIDRFISPIFYLIGIPCNPLCAYIWLGRHTRRSNSSAIYLGALSISHTVFLVLHIFNDLKYAWGIPTIDGHVACELFYTAYYLPQYLAPLLVMGFTVERYIAVCYPFVKEKYCTVRRAVLVVVALLVFCFLLSCVQAYLWTFDDVYEVCNHRVSVRNSQFLKLWTWLTELGIFGVAPLAALAFNILVIREIRSITSRGPAVTGSIGGGGRGGGGVGGGGGSPGQNQASTVTLLSVSFYLICTWLPATLVYSLEREFPLGVDLPPADEADARVWQRHFTYYTVRKAVEEVTLSNSACYFFIYYFTGKHFRVRFRQMILPARLPSALAGRGNWTGDGDGTLYNGRSLVTSSKQYIAVPCKDNGHHTNVTNV